MIAKNQLDWSLPDFLLYAMRISNSPMPVEQLDCVFAVVGDDHIVGEVEPSVLDVRMTWYKETAYR